ncbi:hypothetical protein BA086_21075 [Salmonella enterica]|uniref:Transposase n=1 Tax=Salmonella enterica TaxID=28901 RepID=A0A402XJD8_SALER|nr:hypothetical protein [Salmonella enterica]EBQ2950352.1 hypothetical protein [Salmonella enterica]MIV65486.1 hypothetical protein [Salmonella enterica]
MPAYQVCQNFFRDTLAPFHKYRQNALLDATLALINGASATLTSIGRYLPGAAQVKNKIKRVDRLLGNESLHCDIPLIFKGFINMLTQKLSLCVIAVDWSGYPSQEYHVLRASLLCDGRSLPLLSWIVPSEKQQNSQIQKAFLDALAGPVNPKARIISYLTLAENILRHSPLILRRTVLSTVLNHFARTYRSMVLVY